MMMILRHLKRKNKRYSLKNNLEKKLTIEEQFELDYQKWLDSLKPLTLSVTKNLVDNFYLENKNRAASDITLMDMIKESGYKYDKKYVSQLIDMKILQEVGNVKKYTPLYSLESNYYNLLKSEPSKIDAYSTDELNYVCKKLQNEQNKDQ